MRKEIIEIEISGTQESIKKTNDLKKSINNVNNETKEVSKNSNELGSTLDKVSGGAVSKFKGMLSSIKSVSSGFNALKVAIIGTGIGALLIAVVALGKAFTSSEEGQNKFAKLMGVIGSVTGNLIDILANLGEKIIWVFENPKKAINDFTKLIKENIINRFNGLLELIPQLGKSINQLFKGDFSGAAETAANAVAKVALGTENLTQSVRNASVALKDMAKEIADDAKKAAEIADKRAKADKIERDLIIQRAEANRKIADLRYKSEQRNLYSANERVKFLKEASKIEEEITNKEIYSAQLRANAKMLENTLSKSTKEDLDEEAQLKAKVIELDTAKLNLQKRLQTSITSFQNEEKAGLKAISDAKQKEIDDAKAIEIKKAEESEKIEKARLEAIDAIQKEYNIKKENEEAESELQKLELQKTRELKRLEELNASEEEKANIILYWNKKINDQKQKDSNILKEKEEENRQIDIANEKALQQQKISFAKNAFGAIGDILGQQTAAGKATAAASALINTYQGISNVWAEKAESGLVGAGLIQRIATTAIVAAQGFATVKNILKTKVPSGGGYSGGGGVSAPSSIPQAQIPNFNITGSSSTNQLADAISGQNKEPVKAYVVSSEVTTAQSMERNIIESAAIG